MGAAEDDEELVAAVEVVGVGEEFGGVVDIEDEAEFVDVVDNEAAAEVADVAELVLLVGLVVVEASPLMTEKTDPLMVVSAIAKVPHITTR